MFKKRSEYCVNDANLNTRNDCQDSERMDPEKQSLMFDGNKKCINEKKKIEMWWKIKAIHPIGYEAVIK